MRHIEKLLTVTIFIISLVSCVKESKNTEITISAPKISSLEQSMFTIPEIIPEDVVFRMFWSAARYFEDGVVDKNISFAYAVEFSSATDDFTSPIELAFTDDLQFLDINYPMLETIYRSISETEGFEENEAAIVALRIRASHGNSIAYSEKVLITVSPYVAPPVLTSVEKSKFDAPADSEVRLLYPGQEDTPAFSLSWSEPIFHFGETTQDVTPVQYALEMDSKDGGFARQRTVLVTEETEGVLNNTQLNNIIVGEFGGKPFTPIM